MITNYPEKTSLKEVLSTSLSTTSLKAICKSNGIFILTQDKDIIVRDAHLFFWGYNDINRISNFMEDEKNYKKSFRLKLTFEASDNSDPETTAFADIYTKMTIYRNSMAVKDNIQFESLNILDSVLIGEISYVKKRPGKVELLSETTQRFSFQVKKSGDNAINLDFIFNDRSDIFIAKKMITNMLATSEEFSTPTQISLKALTIPERVGLFDRFFGYNFTNWRIISIQGIKISDGANAPEDEEEAEEMTESILSGIKSALLNGSGLRSNPIVTQAVERGYFFPKATIMFEHRREAQRILIDVAFNSDELLLEINVVSTYEVEEGRAYKHPFLADDQKVALEDFHDVISEIYGALKDERLAAT